MRPQYHDGILIKKRDGAKEQASEDVSFGNYQRVDRTNTV